jgi:hypothetical protein
VADDVVGTGSTSSSCFSSAGVFEYVQGPLLSLVSVLSVQQHLLYGMLARLSCASSLTHCLLLLSPAPRLRFDFSNNGAIEPAKLEKIEAICREWVAAGRTVSSKEVSLAQAKAIKGLRAVFGEVGGG